uniref:Uncharacterized protein n=1 Tax=Arundo donax TaxID=35708 RepID=A0A0A8Z0Q0_ARUDO
MPRRWASGEEMADGRR